MNNDHPTDELEMIQLCVQADHPTEKPRDGPFMRARETSRTGEPRDKRQERQVHLERDETGYVTRDGRRRAFSTGSLKASPVTGGL